MRSKTSFFNGTLFWKSIRRFWPLWTAHLIIWLMILPLPLLRQAREYRIDESDFAFGILSAAKGGGLVMGFIFAVLSAMAVWSFLYNSRSAGGMGCLPVRREAQFGSALLAGFLPLGAGLVVTALFTLPVCLMERFSPLPLLSFLGISLLILFYFTCFATLCAQLTGHVLILPAVYLVLSFVAAGVEFLLRGVMSRFVYGLAASFRGDVSAIWLTPVLGFAMGTEVQHEYLQQEDGIFRSVGVSFQGWSVLLSYAAAGILLLILALLLFRRRRMETAGDVVAVGFLRPVFRWCMALGCGLVLASLVQFILFYGYDDVVRAFPSLLISFLLGAFIGWFSGEMLMKKTFRVFRGRIWAGFGLCCAVILVLMLGMRYDLFGYERRVPRADQVTAVSLQGGGEYADLKEGESILQALALHRAILADKELNLEPDHRHITCRLTYTLRGGRELTRYYELAVNDEDISGFGEAAELQALLNCPEAIRSRKEPKIPVARQNIEYAVVYGQMPVSECAAASGWGDPELYLLTELRGFAPEEAEAMDPARRREEIQRVLEDYGLPGWEYGRTYLGPKDLEGVWSEFSLTLTEQEAEELYRDCIQPDILDGALGRVWIILDRDYRRTVCSARIEINLAVGNVKYKSGEPERAFFYTVPTVSSLRTNAWLEARGFHVHTVEETP